MNFKTCKFNNNLFSDSARAIALEKHAKNFLGYAEFDGNVNEWHGDSVLIYVIDKKEWLAVVVNNKKATFFIKTNKKNIQSASDMKALVQLASNNAIDENNNADAVKEIRNEKNRIQQGKDKSFLAAVRENGGFGNIYANHQKANITEEELHEQDLGDTQPLI